MPTTIKVRESNVIDAGIGPSYFNERGFTVSSSSSLNGVTSIVLAEDLTDEQKEALGRDLRIDLPIIITDVLDAAETETTTKKRYMRVMERCTEAVIRRGFLFQAKTFSLDTFAQLRLLRYFIIRANLAYPFAVPNIENTDGIQVNDSAEMQDLFVAGHTAQFTMEQDGITNKTTVRNAASKAAARIAAETYLTTNGCVFLVSSLD